MNFISRHIYFIIISLIIINGCKKKEDISDIPFIEFISFTEIADGNQMLYRGIYKFSFKDKDGDIGYEEEDPASSGNNLFVKYFRKKQGIFEDITPLLDSSSINYRIPNITPQGQNKMIKGDIEIKIDIPVMTTSNIVALNDTLQIEMYLKDRAQNSSNTIRSGDIIIKKN